MLKALSLALVLAAAACGGGSKSTPDTTPDTTAKTPAAGGDILALGEMKLVDVNKNKALLIHADGTIELDGQKPAKVTADGKIIKISTGEVGFTLNPDGSVTGLDGKDLGIKVSEDGVLTMGDKTITLDAQGMLVGGNPDAPPMRVEGATDAKLKRTAMFVLVVLSSGSEGGDGAPASSP